jgi:hypothetical protein
LSSITPLILSFTRAWRDFGEEKFINQKACICFLFTALL